MRRLGIFLFIILISTLQISWAQLTPQLAIAEMGRGINLGNTLEPPLEGSWNNGPAQESYFDAYVDAGFSNIRIPVRWDQHTGNTAPFSIDSTWMNRVEEVVDWGLSRGFYITLNGHHEDWIKNNYNNATLRARYDSIWVQVAERFKNKSEKLLFEIINEPKGMTVAQVDDLNQRILGIIRQTNPTRIVIYGGNEWSNAEQLLIAAIPSDPYIIGYYHSYDPWQFSGQGNGTWGTPNDYQQITNKYQSVKNWSTTNNIPVHHSEFGALLRCDYNSRMRIYAHNVEQCIVNGFAFSAWDDGGDFRILDRANNAWPEVKDILVHYHEDSPNQIFSTFKLDTLNNAPTIVVDWNNRATGNSDYVIERSLGASNNFIPLDTLPASATSYTDVAVDSGNTYTYRMYTRRTDSTLLYGYPTRLRIIASVQSPFNGSPIQIPGDLEVEDFDNGGEGLAYHDSDPNNIFGDFRISEGVDIGTYGNGYLLGYVANGEWVEYTVDVTQAGIYSVDIEVASEVANGSFNISFDKNNATASFVAPNTGGWVTFQTITSPSIELEAGVQQMRLNITNNNPFNIDKLTFNLQAVNVTETEDELSAFKVSPNPTKGLLNIDLSETLQEKNIRLQLFNLTGEQVAAYNMDGLSTHLDLSIFASGVYLLKLVGDGVSLVHRIVKY